MENENRKPRTKLPMRKMEECYFRAEEVARYLSIGFSTVWGKSKNNHDDFPSPRKVSARVSLWKKSELDNWANRNNAIKDIGVVN